MAPKGVGHVRAETIGWGRPVQGKPPQGRPPEPSPWTGRMLGMLLLVLALAAIYHGTAGQAVWRELTGYVSGTQSVQAPSATAAVAPTKAQGPAAISYGTGTTADAVASAAADTEAASADVASGDFGAATTDLAHLSRTWLTLSGSLAQDGVPVLDINDFTAVLSDAQSEVAVNDATLARSDMTRLTSEMNVLSLAYVSQEAPTFSELKDLATDLSAGVLAHNWSRVASDSRALSDLVHTIQQGY